MKRKTALLEPTANRGQHRLGLRLRLAVDNGIVRVPFEQHTRIRSPHPSVERVMQEEIGQQRTEDAQYAKGNFQFERMIVAWREQLVLDLRRK
jgi:hypothetical protein